MTACHKVIERDTEGLVHTACPDDAADEVLIQVNGLPYIVPMCRPHQQEFHRQAAAARTKRNHANQEAKRRAEERWAAAGR